MACALVVSALAGVAVSSIDSLSTPRTLLVVVAVGTVIVAIRLGREYVDPTSVPVWLLLAVSLYILVPLPAVMSGVPKPGLLGQPSASTASLAAFLTVAQLGVFAVGWARGNTRSDSSGTATPAVPIAIPSMRSLLVLQVSALLLASIPYLASGQQLSTMLATVSEEGYSASTNPLFNALQSLYLFASTAFIVAPVALILRAHIAQHHRILAWGNLLVAAGLLSAIGVRFRLVLLVSGALLAVYLAARSRSRDRARRYARNTFLGLAVVTLALAPLVAFIGQQRSVTARDQPLDVVSSTTIELNLLSSDAALLEWIESNGLLFAASFTDAPKLLVPRAVWPSKPESSTLAAVYEISDRNAGVAVSSSAELTLNFGFVGSLIAAGLLGVVVGRIQSRIPRDFWGLTCLALIGPVSAQIFTRGFLTASVMTTVSILGPPLVLRAMHWGIGRPEGIPLPGAGSSAGTVKRR